VANRGKHRFLEANEVHLVDRHYDLADAEQGGYGGVAAGLRQDTFTGIDQQNGQIGGRGTGDHVAGVLLMPRRIGQDEAAGGSLEEAIGDVDGHPLLAFSLQAIDQQSVVDRAVNRPEAF
jgi:hypothetical protein